MDLQQLLCPLCFLVILILFFLMFLENWHRRSLKHKENMERIKNNQEPEDEDSDEEEE